MNDTTLSGISEVGNARHGSLVPQPQLYLVLECDAPQLGGSRHSLAGVDEVELGRGSVRGAARTRGADGKEHLRLAFTDRRLSSVHARIIRVSAQLCALEDAGSKNGTFLNGETVRQRVLLSDGDIIEAGSCFMLYRAAVAMAMGDGADALSSSLAPPAPELTTLLPELAADFAELVRMSSADSTIALLGETGTGKEVVARAIHAIGARGGPFVPVNCGALPANLVESELFGYKKGAFSGADADRTGLVRSAEGGTLFLDEIGDLPLASQTALLRVIQEREVVPLGARRAEKIDVRIISATHRDIPAMVAREQFRSDLWARLSGFVVQLPPLRARREDLGVLTVALLRRLAPERIEQLAIDRASARAMMRHAWPHNIRELENVLRAGVALSKDDALRLRLEAPSVPPPAATPGAPGAPTDDAEALDERTPVTGQLRARREQIITRLLKQHDGNVAAVARAIGKPRQTLHRWMTELGLSADKFRK